LLYGLTATADSTALVQQDIITGQLKTVAKYRPPVPAWELIGDTLRFSVHPSGRSLLTTTYTSRSNVWSMTGVQWSQPWLTRW